MLVPNCLRSASIFSSTVNPSSTNTSRTARASLAGLVKGDCRYVPFPITNATRARGCSGASACTNPRWARLTGAREMKSNAITARDIELFGRREDRLFRLLQSKAGILRPVRFQTNCEAHLKKPLANADNSILVCISLPAGGRDDVPREESSAVALLDRSFAYRRSDHVSFPRVAGDKSQEIIVDEAVIACSPLA